MALDIYALIAGGMAADRDGAVEEVASREVAALLRDEAGQWRADADAARRHSRAGVAAVRERGADMLEALAERVRAA